MVRELCRAMGLFPPTDCASSDPAYTTVCLFQLILQAQILPTQGFDIPDDFFGLRFCLHKGRRVVQICDSTVLSAVHRDNLDPWVDMAGVVWRSGFRLFGLESGHKRHPDSQDGYTSRIGNPHTSTPLTEDSLAWCVSKAHRGSNDCVSHGCG